MPWWSMRGNMKVKTIDFSLIPGFMFGIEWAYDFGFVIVDLGIMRICWDYVGFDLPPPVDQAPQ
jgi:hypothetical protein